MDWRMLISSLNACIWLKISYKEVKQWQLKTLSLILSCIFSNGSTIEKFSKLPSSDITKTTKSAKNGCGHQLLQFLSYALNCYSGCLNHDWVFMLCNRTSIA